MITVLGLPHLPLPFQPIWEKLESYKALVFMHPGVMAVTPRLIGRFLPQPIIDYPQQTTEKPTFVPCKLHPSQNNHLKIDITHILEVLTLEVKSPERWLPVLEMVHVKRGSEIVVNESLGLVLY